MIRADGMAALGFIPLVTDVQGAVTMIKQGYAGHDVSEDGGIVLFHPLSLRNSAISRQE